MSLVCLEFGDSGEFDLSVCQLEKATNAADPAVLDIVDGDFGFLLDLD